MRGVPWRSSSSAAPSIGEAISTTWKPGASGNTHHLEGAGIIICRLGQVQRLHARLPDQQRDHARLHLVAFIGVQRARQRALTSAAGLLRGTVKLL